MVTSKKELAILLSSLPTFETPSVALEQYPTPSDIAADWVWQMAMRKEVLGKIILDAGCGNGILGLALLLLGAKKVYFVDVDENVLKICKKNYKKIKDEYEIGTATFKCQDISLFTTKVDVVVQNPPFGTKQKHHDKIFLEKAIKIAPLVYSMHKYNTTSFVEAVAKDFGFVVTNVWRFEFALKASFSFHKKKVQEIDVGLFRLEKKS